MADLDTATLCSSQDSVGSTALPPPSYSTIPGTVPLYHGKTSGPPPSYEEVVDPEGTAPPPSYQSLFGQVREARRTSNGFFDFLRKVLIIFFGTLGCTIIIGTTVVIPVAMTVIGFTYLNNCPAEPYIPIYLIVGGMFGVLKNVMNCWSRCCKSDEDSEERLRQRPEDTILNCFLFAWFIAGCVWIYRIYEPVYDDSSSLLYCHKTVYQFAFWLVTSAYIILAVITCCLCCLTVSSLLASPE